MSIGFAALRIRNYRLYWIGHVISKIGTWMQQVSLPWLALTMGGSPIDLGIIAALQFVPSLFVGPLGGVYADRVDKRRAVFITQVLATCQVLCLLALILVGAISIAWIMVLSLALGFVSAVDQPLRQSLAAELVPREQLANAVALTAIAANTARIVGPAIGGVTIAVGTSMFGSPASGVAFNLAINAASFSAVLIALLRMDPAEIREPTRSDRAASVVESLREGVAYAARRPMVVMPLVLLAIVSTFGVNFRILLPLYTQDTLHLGADAYGALYSALAVGAMGGALHLAFLQERRLTLFLVGGTVVFSAALFGLAITASFVPAAILLVIAGFSQIIMKNTVVVAVQMDVQDELRGRVMALYSTVNQGSTPIGGIVAGALVAFADVQLAFAVGAAICLAGALAIWARLSAADDTRAPQGST